MINKNKIIVLDVDGPLTAFDEQILELVRPGTTFQELEDLRDWDVFKILNEEQLIETHNILEDVQFWYNLKPRDLSQKIVNVMREDDNEVIFCTAPWTGCKEWDLARREWLIKHFGAKGREDIIITARKDVIYGDLFIDDKPSNVLEWKRRWTPHKCYGLLYETHTNKFENIWPRVRAKENDWEFIKK